MTPPTDVTPEGAPPDRAAILAAMRQTASVLSLPLRKGATGGGLLLQRESGSSLEFRDHRPYVPGDDPRQINWRAYARSDQYTLKLHHRESSPLVEILVDVSASMRLTRSKERRMLELLAFCLESTGRAGASVRLHAASGPHIESVQPDHLATLDLPLLPGGDGLPPAADRVAWRAGSFRVVISDLLHPGDPRQVLGPAAHGASRLLLFVPCSREESMPEWPDQAEFRDCESGRVRLQRVSPVLRERYLAAYANHFALWDTTAIQTGCRMARVACEPPFADALRAEALPRGLVESR